MATPSSDSLFGAAQRFIPGGVNSPVRAFRAVGGSPFFVSRAEGPRIWDVEGRSYVDYVGSWGPLILGHAPRQVVEAVATAATRGTSYGAPTPGEVKLAELLVDALPSIEMIRLVNSGTEATMSAIRLARGVTGRDVIVKFDGCYHGHADGLLVKAGSGGITFSLPDSRGVPAAVAQLTITLPYNDTHSVKKLFDAESARIAAVIVEPIAGNMGVVPPLPGFLQTLRDECTRSGALLIFDEVITGFRVGYGGAQSLYNIRPDLTCLGKIIGGGLPVGAYGGGRDLMKEVAPLGQIYQAGTLSGNPLAVAAGLATLSALRGPEIYERLDHAGEQLHAGLESICKEAGIPATINRVGSMLTLFFTDSAVTDLSSAKRSDTQRYAKCFHGMLSHGVFLPPSQFEALFLSAAHTSSEIDQTLDAARHAIRGL